MSRAGIHPSTTLNDPGSGARQGGSRIDRYNALVTDGSASPVTRAACARPGTGTRAIHTDAISISSLSHRTSQLGTTLQADEATDRRIDGSRARQTSRRAEAAGRAYVVPSAQPCICMLRARAA